MKLFKVIILCGLIFSVFAKNTYCQTVPPISVIIDTDCGQDDLRALCLLTAIKQVDIKAVVTSDGSLSPQEGLYKVAQLIGSVDRKKIPIAAGRTSNLKAPVWREFCRNVSWGNKSNDTLPDIK